MISLRSLCVDCIASDVDMALPGCGAIERKLYGLACNM